MANTDFGILLKTLLDKSGINSELEQVQKIVNKYSIDIMPELKTASLKNQMKAVSQEIANDFNKAFGTNLTGNDVFKAYEKQAKQTEKTISDAKKKRLSEQEKYYNKIINNNKEIYALKEKKLSADKEESKELQRQITNLEKRNKRAYDSISQKGLGDKDLALEVSNSEKELKNRLAIKEARLKDKSNAQEQAHIEQQIAEYNKQELEYKKKRQQYEAEAFQQSLDEESLQYYKQEEEYLKERNKHLAEGKAQQDAYNETVAEYTRLFDESNAINDEELLRQSIEYYEQEKYYQEERAKALAEGKAQEEAYNREVKETTDSYKQMAKEADKAYEARQRMAKANAEKVDEIQLLFDNGHGASDYKNRITEIEQSFEKYGLSVDEAKAKTQSLRDILDGFKVNGNFITDDQLVLQADKLEKEFDAIKISVTEAKLAYDKFVQPVTKEKASELIIRINNFLSKNTAITEDAKIKLQAYIRELESGVNLSRWNELNLGLKETEMQMRKMGKLGNSLTQTFKNAVKSFLEWTTASGAVMEVFNTIRQGVGELKNLDDILTEISKTSDLTTSQLKKLGNEAFESASKYGKSASDYLTGVQEMYRSGFSNAEEMAELSVLAQSAGDMDKTLANDYLLATNAAYKYKGSVEELTKVLNGQNYITNNAAISMKDIADATTETASVAAQYGVQIDELSALIATATANTRESGSEVGTALKAIMINLQDTTSKPVTETFDALGISMTKVINGSEQLKTPIELIYELADAYNSLPEGDIMRANILNEIGQKRHANTLAAVLSDMSGLNHMLELYNSNLADNSAYNEAMKSANNWSGSLNKVKNSMNDLIQNIVNSDAVIGFLDTVNSIIVGIDKLTEKIGALGTIGIGAGAFLGAKGSGLTELCYTS